MPSQIAFLFVDVGDRETLIGCVSLGNESDLQKMVDRLRASFGKSPLLRHSPVKAVLESFMSEHDRHAAIRHWQTVKPLARLLWSNPLLGVGGAPGDGAAGERNGLLREASILLDEELKLWNFADGDADPPKLVRTVNDPPEPAQAQPAQVSPDASRARANEKETASSKRRADRVKNATALLKQGYSGKEIAAQLRVSEATVCRDLQSVRRQIDETQPD